MIFDALATPCGLYCGSCRYYMVEECGGCGSEDRQGCEILKCCREERNLRFCAECDDFPCDRLRNSVGLHPDWLDDQAALPWKKG
jgi:hypothetical protein